MARLASVMLLSLLVASVLSASPDVCGVVGAEPCEDEDSSMLQLKSQQSQLTSSAVSGSGSYNYKSFHLGNWTDISATCGGTSQTGFQAPINIAVDGADYESMPRTSWPKFRAKDGGCEEAYFAAKGTAWQVTFIDEDANIDCTNLEMEWNGKTYALVQFHFHTLSEDTLDFQPTEMQMHMVHLAEDGSFAVVGAMIKTKGWKKNRFLKDVFGAGFDSNRKVSLNGKQKFNPYDGVLQKSGEFWYYPGSFTTPPCTEGVDFLIAQSPVVTSHSYVASYMEYLKGSGAGNSYGQNHRPIQPLNDRVITTGRFSMGGAFKPCGKLDPKNLRLGEAA